MGIFIFIGGGELFFTLFIVLLLFGAKRIPEFARMMGKGMHEFRKATDEIKRQINEETKDVKNDINNVKDTLKG